MKSADENGRPIGAVFEEIWLRMIG